ncbi:MAG: nucleotidyltransferase family protein [Chloroflexi bacterium]|nr:nucleotidyltransferase family protein [Chloroflexota bacterium]
MNDLNEPWVELPTARFLLRWLSGDEMSGGGELMSFSEPAALAGWLTRQGLGALAYGRCRPEEAGLRRCLQADMFSAAAESSLKQTSLQAILRAFAAAGVQMALLKGAVLSLTVYEEPAWRTMSDIDIWTPAEAMQAAAAVMTGLGYVVTVKGERPFALQQLSRGEIQFVQPNMPAGLVELHWSAFSGWWLTRTAAVDEAGLWARRELLSDWPDVAQLAAEDMVIHLAVHTAVNHQFGLSALRSLVDIALTAHKRGVDWAVAAERARTWRVGTAVYTVLSLLDELIGVEGLAVALEQLRPTGWRSRAIGRFVTPASVLAGRDLRSGWQRFLLLLLLVDRKRDMAKLVWRTLWPEQEWLAARYGRSVSHWRHLWTMLRQRAV